MALLALEGFETYGTGTITSSVTKRWDGSGSGVSSTGTFSASAGREQGVGVGGALFGDTEYLSGWDIGQKQTLIIGFGLKLSNLSNQFLFSFFDGNSPQTTLKLESQKLRLFRGTVTAITGGIGTTTFVSNTWYYIEIKITYNGSEGSCEVRINNTPEISVSGLSVQNTVNNYADSIRIFPSARSVWDDMYIADTSGTTNNDFLGIVTVYGMTPNAVGTHSDFTVTGAANNYEAVDEDNPDGDSSYVRSTTVDAIDTYGFTNPTITGNVLGVDFRLYGRSEETATNVAPLARVDGTDYELDSKTFETPSYGYVNHVEELNPATGEAWTQSDLQNSEFGFKKK